MYAFPSASIGDEVLSLSLSSSIRRYLLMTQAAILNSTTINRVTSHIFIPINLNCHWPAISRADPRRPRPMRRNVHVRKSTKSGAQFVDLTFSFTGNELEVTGNVKNLSPMLWTLSQLTVLYVNDNQLTRLPSEIACLTNLVTLDLSNNKLRNLPSEIGRGKSLCW